MPWVIIGRKRAETGKRMTSVLTLLCRRVSCQHVTPLISLMGTAMTQGQWHTGGLFESQEEDMMTMRALDTPPYDSTVNVRDLEALAREAHVPFEDVAQLYDRELAALAAGAHI